MYEPSRSYESLIPAGTPVDIGKICIYRDNGNNVYVDVADHEGFVIYAVPAQILPPDSTLTLTFPKPKAQEDMEAILAQNSQRKKPGYPE